MRGRDLHLHSEEGTQIHTGGPCDNYTKLTVSFETRLGMHLLFYGKEQIALLGNKRVYELLHEQSIKVLPAA